MDINEKIEIFKRILEGVNREGRGSLMAFIESSDFFVAPASTRFHGAYEGGLLEHSLNVYECLNRKKHTDALWSKKLENITDESIVIASLLHDICKTYYYAIEMRNKKVDGTWVQVPFYTVNDRIPYGHGEKSVMMIEEYMKLKPVERYAIR